MTFPLIEGNFSGDAYNRALSTAYSLWSRLNNPDYALARDPEIWEKCRRDATIAQAIDTRLHMVAGRTWHCETGGNDQADREAAALCDELLGNLKSFTESRLQLATACFRARAYAFIEGREEVRTYGDGRPRKWWVPIRLRDVDPRRVRYVPEHYRGDDGLPRVKVRQELWSVMREEFEEIPQENLAQFVKIIYRNEEANLGYGRGLLSSIYFLWWMKSIVWREGLQGLERWSQGVLIGKVASDREGSTGRTNEAIRDDLFEALRDMRSRNVIVMGAEDDIEVRDGGGAGHSMVMSFIEYMDTKLLSLILGSVLPFGGGAESGSYARAQIEQETSNALIQFDRDKVDECLTDDLIGLVWDANWNNIQDLGLGGAKYPRFQTDLTPHEDPAQATSIISQLSSLGLKLRLADVYQKTGFAAPGPEDEVFEAKEAAPAAPGSPFNFSGRGSEWRDAHASHTWETLEDGTAICFECDTRRNRLTELEACKPGQTAERSGCTPSEGNGGGEKKKGDPGKLKTLAKKVLAIVNLGPTYAKAIAEEAGVSERVAGIAYTMATIGDIATPGLPTGSAAVIIAATIKKPSAPVTVTKNAIASIRDKMKKKKPEAAGARFEEEEKPVNRLAKIIENHENPDWFLELMAYALELTTDLDEAISIALEGAETIKRGELDG